MTNLENFLNKKPKNSVTHTFDTAEGSFSCQNPECNEIVNEAGIDREKNKIFWSCLNGHESSVAI